MDLETLVAALQRLLLYDKTIPARTYANWLVDGYTEQNICNAIDIADACDVSVQSVLDRSMDDD